MKKRYSNQKLYLVVAIMFFLSFAAVYGIYGKGQPLYKSLAAAKGATRIVKPKIKTDTVIEKEIRYLCRDKVSTKIPTTSDLVGMDFTGLVKKFPPEKGWNIDDTVKNTLLLARAEKQVCPYHREFRHLGIGEGYLAVYEGPLGYNYKVLQREDISIDSLPPEIQADLNMAMDYDNQAQDNQGKLKSMFEFENGTQLNSTLENFDEFRE